MTALREAAAAGRGLVAEGFPLERGLRVDLELAPFAVTSPRTRFVVGRRHGPDEPLDFDPAALALFRGTVRGHRGSAAFLAIGDDLATGYVDLGDGAVRYRLASRGAAGEPLGVGRTAVFPATAAPEPPPDVPVCGVGTHPADGRSADAVLLADTPGPTPRLKQLELAVETDYEYFQLFGELDAAAAYLVALYGEISDIYVRDVDTRVELVYARLWDDPDDLFNTGPDSPLFDFLDHWNTYMGAVTRDAAQFFSGRRDFPFGGQAYVSALCGTTAYSVVGYASGFFPDPTRPSSYHYDIAVAAHELGHNSGTLHTHDNGIDTCNNPSGTPQRGTIMSYCGQTWSGGNANRDLYFHRSIQPSMDGHIASSTCLATDCNANGIEDAADILVATSPDADSDGVPDECEDCNDNGVLDPADIGLGASQDLNLNGIPDECEPDCNGNLVPDAKDIVDGTSLDAYGNGVPDECELDCNANGTSDFTEIQLDMTLDVDRDARLDACQDCDLDGSPDLAELDGAHYLWVASGQPAAAGQGLRQFHPRTGVLSRTTAGAVVDGGSDVLVLPSGEVRVSSSGGNRVLEFDRAGAYVREVVPPGAGGLDEPAGLALTPDGSLMLVASRNTDSVLAYDALTGQAAGAFVPAGSGGLVSPFGLVFGPNGNLFVTSATDEVLEYDGGTGAFLRAFVSAADNGALSDPRGLVFKGDGNLLVASFGSDTVIEYDASAGAHLGQWAKVGTPSVLTQTSPWGIRVGPNGNVFVGRTGEDFGSGPAADLAHAHGDEHDESQHLHSLVVNLHLTNAQIYEYDVRNGNFLRTLIGGNDHGLVFPTGFAFVPGWDVDCNANQLQDACDVTSGASADADGDGTPDECQVDCNANAVADRLELIPYGSATDCNANLRPDACDVADGDSQDCSGNGIPDECEPDCNGNGVADSCDLMTGLAGDCNANGLPDECEIYDDLEGGTIGWIVGAPGDDAVAGSWERVNPIGSTAQPDVDRTPGAGRVAYVTGQGAINGSPSSHDVDGGRTTLISPAIDLSGAAEAKLGYWRWFSNDRGFNPAEDVLTVDVSRDDGGSWVGVEVVGPTGDEVSGGWRYHDFRVADFVEPSATVRLRFVAADLLGESTVEAAIDDLVVLTACCESPAEVTALGVQGATGTTLSWPAELGASFDVAGGLLSAVRADGGVQSATCLADGLTRNVWADPQPDPPPGQGYYYLVRAETACGAGSYGLDSSGAERQPDAACP